MGISKSKGYCYEIDFKSNLNFKWNQPWSDKNRFLNV